MKTKLIYLFLSVVLFSCTKNNPKMTPYNDSIKKIIITRTYTTKTEFNELKLNSPVYNGLGYDKSVGLELDWTINHLDKYSNIIYQEEFMYDTITNREIVTRKVTNEYYSDKDHKLSKVTIDNLKFGFITKLYLRNNLGILIEINKFDGKHLNEKTVFYLNEINQRIKEEVYEKDGLSAVYNYVYDKPSLKDGKIIQETYVKYENPPNKFLSEWHREETDYIWDDSGKLNMTHIRYYQEGVKLSDYTTTYKDYIGDIASVVIKKGFENIFLSRDKNNKIDTSKFGPSFYSILKLDINEKGDISKVDSKVQYLSKSGAPINYYPILSLGGTIVEYLYNERNDWIKLILTSPLGEKYISTREIIYL